RKLALLTAPSPAQAIQRGVSGGPVQPSRCVVGRRGVQAVEIDENFLGHVLRLVRIGEDAVGDPDDAPIFGCEKGFERFVVSASGLRRRELREISSSMMPKSARGNAWM